MLLHNTVLLSFKEKILDLESIHTDTIQKATWVLKYVQSSFAKGTSCMLCGCANVGIIGIT